MNMPLRSASHARFYATKPQCVDSDGTRHWIVRGANVIVVFSEAEAGALLARHHQEDEYMVLLPAGAGATIRAGNEVIESSGNSLSIVPAGSSDIRMKEAGRIVRIFSAHANDLAQFASNAEIYNEGAPEVAPLTAWPDPIGGFKLRHYPLDNYPSPDPSPLKMRIFRSTNMMVNIFMPWERRRDETKLSPHSHDDFEQISLCLDGSFVHHLRYPWTPDKTKWRSDEHEHYDTPSAVVIPARVIHTTQDVGPGTTWMVDVFAPPRIDFSQRAGMVLNAADYPMPT